MDNTTKTNLENMFYCFGCAYLLDDPSESQCCGKLYCQACQVDFAKSFCTICKGMIKFRKNLFAKNLMKDFEINCKHKCGSSHKYDDLRKHLLSCPLKRYNCKIENCKFSGLRKDLDKHLVDHHLANMLILMENFSEFKNEFNKIKDNAIEPRLNSVDYRPTLPSENFQYTYYDLYREDPIFSRVFGDIYRDRYRPSNTRNETVAVSSTYDVVSNVNFEQNLNHESEYAYFQDLQDSVNSEGRGDQVDDDSGSII
jgi:hypothetical protein